MPSIFYWLRCKQASYPNSTLGFPGMYPHVVQLTQFLLSKYHTGHSTAVAMTWDPGPISNTHQFVGLPHLLSPRSSPESSAMSCLPLSPTRSQDICRHPHPPMRPGIQITNMCHLLPCPGGYLHYGSALHSQDLAEICPHESKIGCLAKLIHFWSAKSHAGECALVRR